jgi:hypothetical protein
MRDEGRVPSALRTPAFGEGVGVAAALVAGKDGGGLHAVAGCAGGEAHSLKATLLYRP